ncbi:c-type cytochrome [Marinivivus vitaminiproducens]|uniref:c-type cytochrome n=1 Tax=Marinivivus vitaminiproducens TaxID=3035935 RepID=UPI00279DCFC8|nr:cytochrome c [Geminicoccaceae bacterium SCSIO 64248]
MKAPVWLCGVALVAGALSGARAQEASDTVVRRGADLVDTEGACGSCHSPKTADGDDLPGRELKGHIMDGWLAPDITGDPVRGIGAWTDAELAEYLRTGANRFDIASGPMIAIIESVTAAWSDDDMAAAAAYLRSLSTDAPPAPQPVAASDPAMAAGEAIYADRCAACHAGSGEGAKGLFPRLAGAPLAVNDDPISLIRVVLAGSRAGSTDAVPTAPSMPSFAWNLSNGNVADVLTYVRNAWGNAAPPVTPDQVEALRSELAPE